MRLRQSNPVRKTLLALQACFLIPIGFCWLSQSPIRCAQQSAKINNATNLLSRSGSFKWVDLRASVLYWDHSAETWSALTMQKVAVFGNAGGGKSTLSKQLSDITGLPLYVLDKLQYQAGGVKVSEEDNPAIASTHFESRSLDYRRLWFDRYALGEVECRRYFSVCRFTAVCAFWVGDQTIFHESHSATRGLSRK